jgi:hypothetical protein
MRRRDLLARLPLFLMAIPVVGACVAEDEYPKRPPGGHDGTGNPPPDDGTDDANFRVENQDSSGHSHWFEISCANLDDGTLTYTAQGPHTHQVTITEAQLDDVLAGDTVTVQTTAGHPHTWVIAMPSELC